MVVDETGVDEQDVIVLSHIGLIYGRCERCMQVDQIAEQQRA